MKKFFKISGIVIGVLALIIISGLVYLNVKFPNVDPPSTVKIEPTAQMLKRGEYLANHVTVCIDCHSERDWSKYSGPVIPGTIGKGGEKFNQELGGVPGELYSRNITPSGIGSWSDGELMRCITNGVTRENRAIFPLMPYLAYQKLTQPDLYSITAYIRTLKPIENTPPESRLDFPMNMIVKTIPPKSYTPQPEPNSNNPREYGKYLVQIAACGDCHTPADKGKPLPGMEFAGGFEFKLPSGTVRSANITPDSINGIGAWSKEQFIGRFKSFDPDSTKPVNVDIRNDFNTPMPWTMFAGMSVEDLNAIYEYLRTIKPVNNTVNKFTRR